jgi:MipA family protein
MNFLAIPNARAFWNALLAVILGMMVLPCVYADEVREIDNNPWSKFSYAIGGGVTLAPDYLGGADHKAGFRPLIAVRYGRVSVGNSGAVSLSGPGNNNPAAGASAELIESDKLRLTIGLRFDNGRKSGDTAALRGLDDVPRTLRARATANYALSKTLSAGLSANTDLLGRGTGQYASADLSWRHPVNEMTTLSLGGGLTWADRRHIRSYFGVSPNGALASSYPVYSPGGGLMDFHLGAGLTLWLTSRWATYAQAGARALQGDAAGSPLTRQRLQTSVTIGAAYRCCK